MNLILIIVRNNLVIELEVLIERKDMDHSKENTYFGLQIPSQLSNNMNFINILEFLGETQMTKDGYATLVEQELQNVHILEHLIHVRSHKNTRR